jgi:hypothetical protein
MFIESGGIALLYRLFGLYEVVVMKDNNMMDDNDD